MPARSVTIEKRDTAQRTIADASASLAAAFNVPGPADRIYEGRDPAYNQARELEEIAAFLARLADSASETLANIAKTDAANSELASRVVELNAALAKSESALKQAQARLTAAELAAKAKSKP